MASSLGQKLQIKPAIEIDVIHTPDNLRDLLAQELPENLLKFDPPVTGGAVLIFLRNQGDVDSIALPRLEKLDGLLPVWLAYPKGTSGVPTDLSRDILWKMLEPLGWRPARMIALDDVWSCMRFSPMIGKT